MVWFGEEVHCLLDGTPRPSETFFVDREFLPARINRLLQPHDREIGEILGNHFEPAPDFLKFSCHIRDRIRSGRGYGRRHGRS